jgi:hypothetical protein
MRWAASIASWTVAAFRKTMGSLVRGAAPARNAWQYSSARLFFADNSASGFGRPSDDFGHL